MLEPVNLISIGIRDALGITKRTHTYFLADTTLTIGDILIEVGVFVGRLQDCSGGRVVYAQARLEVDVSAFAEKVIEDGASTSNTLILNFPNDADALPWDFVVPGVSSSVIAGGSPDMATGSTIDLLAGMMANEGPTLAGFTFASSRGGDLTPVTSGFLLRGSTRTVLGWRKYK